MALMISYEDIRKACPHLWRSLSFGSVSGKGACFHRSVALALDVPAATLVIGTLRAATRHELEATPNASKVPFIHCWIEIGEAVYAPTTIETLGGLIPMARKSYYAKNGVHNTHYITRATVKRLATVHKWSSHFLRNNPVRLVPSLGEVLLDAAKIAHKVNEEGGVVPA